jgi:hypothetical protein
VGQFSTPMVGQFSVPIYSPGSGAATHGTISVYRTDRVFKELATYSNAWWQWSGDSDEIQGTAKFGTEWSTETYETPFFFSISKIEEQGLFHGENGKPKYFLSRCQILDALSAYPSFREQYEELFPTRKDVPGKSE